MSFTETILRMLAAESPDAVLWDNLDAAIVGIAERDGLAVAVYDYDRMIAVFMDREGWTAEEAAEWVDFNIVGAYVGPGTPLTDYGRDEE